MAPAKVIGAAGSEFSIVGRISELQSAIPANSRGRITMGVGIAEDPLFIDDGAYSLRDENGRDLPWPNQLNPSRNETSFGNVSIQIRRAASALGYNPNNLSDPQRRAIISSLEIPEVNIFIAAKHLSDLRDIDFKGVSASQMNSRAVEIVATRYNRGPDQSVWQIIQHLDYGEAITKRWDMLSRLVR